MFNIDSFFGYVVAGWIGYMAGIVSYYFWSKRRLYKEVRKWLECQRKSRSNV